MIGGTGDLRQHQTLRIVGDSHSRAVLLQDLQWGCTPGGARYAGIHRAGRAGVYLEYAAGVAWQQGEQVVFEYWFQMPDTVSRGPGRPQVYYAWTHLARTERSSPSVLPAHKFVALGGGGRERIGEAGSSRNKEIAGLPGRTIVRIGLRYDCTTLRHHQVYMTIRERVATLRQSLGGNQHG